DRKFVRPIRPRSNWHHDLPGSAGENQRQRDEPPSTRTATSCGANHRVKLQTPATAAPFNGSALVPVHAGAPCATTGFPEQCTELEIQDRSGQDGGNHRFRRSEEHTSELQSRENIVCRLLL